MKKDTGSMPGYQIDGLLKLIGTHKIVIEIGCYRGVSASKIAQQGNRVYCIEPFEGGYDESGVSKELLDKNDVRDNFITNTQNLDILLLEDYSYNAIKYFKPSLIDVLVIDGEHTYEGVKKDIEWIQFVRPGGLIAFHDYGQKKFPGIKIAVDEFIVPKYKLIKKICSLYIFER